MSKRYESLHAKVSAESKAAIAKHAKDAGYKSVSSYLEAAALGEVSVPKHPGAIVAPVLEPLQVYHVDDLGHDSWRRDNGALSR